MMIVIIIPTKLLTVEMMIKLSTLRGSFQTNPDRVGVEKKLAGQLSAASLAAEVNGCHF